MMVFDPYRAYRAGYITAELVAAQEGLDRVFVEAVALHPDSDYREGIVGAIRVAQDAVREARKLDLWELSRPEGR